MKKHALAIAWGLFLIAAALPYVMLDFRLHWLLSLLALGVGWIIALAGILFLALNRKKLDRAQSAIALLAIVLWIYPTFKTAIQFRNDFRLTKMITGYPTSTDGFRRLEFPTKNGATLFLNFYPSASKTPAPLLIVVHGGGWDSGDPSQLEGLNPILQAAGIHVAAVSYRLAPKAQWPAQKEDVLDALMYLKSQAQELHWNGRFAFLGRSAGAQIAGTLAYNLKDPNLCGWIDFYGPMDLLFAYEAAEENDFLNSRQLIVQLLGGTPYEAEKAYGDASPLHAVGPHSPPTLILHGERDPMVWKKHSERLKRRLDHFKIESRLLLFPFGYHGFDFFQHSPEGQISTEAILNFLAKHCG